MIQDLRACFDGLTQEGKCLYAVFGVLPSDETDLPTLAAATRLSIGKTQAAASELVSKQLLEADPGWATYRIQPHIARHAGQEVLDEGERDQALLALAAWYRGVLTRTEEALVPAEAGHLPPASPPVSAVPLPFTSAPDHHREGEREEMLTWLKVHTPRLLPLMEACHERGMSDEVIQLKVRGRASWQLIPSAQTRHEAARLALEAAVEAGDREAEQEMWNLMSGALRNLGRYAEADETGRRALAMGRADVQRAAAAGDQHHLRRAHLAVARHLYEIGAARTGAELYGEAMRVLEESRALYMKAGDPRGMALTDTVRGYCLTGTVRQAEAVQSFETAAHALRNLPRPDPYEVARAQAGLGRAWIAAGDTSQAKLILLAVLEDFRVLGSPHGQAHALEGIGLAHQADGNTDRARSCYEKSLRLYRPRSPRGVCRLQERLQILARSCGD